MSHVLLNKDDIFHKSFDIEEYVYPEDAFARLKQLKKNYQADIICSGLSVHIEHDEPAFFCATNGTEKLMIQITKALD